MRTVSTMDVSSIMIRSASRGFVSFFLNPRYRGCTAGTVFEEAVHRLCLMAGGLCHPLRSPACGRGEKHFLAHSFVNFDNCVDDRGFARTGAAGYHHGLLVIESLSASTCLAERAIFKSFCAHSMA